LLTIWVGAILWEWFVMFALMALVGVALSSFVMFDTDTEDTQNDTRDDEPQPKTCCVATQVTTD